MNRTPQDGLSAAAAAEAETIVGWRRMLHRIPELGFEEHRTARFVAERLDALGFETRTGVAGTGVVACLRSKASSRAAVLLRADMDALPIEEVPGREYGSTIPGRMHACGHDGHMAMLLGAAALLAKARDRLRRDVVFCFQPGEEGHGGALRMIDAGLLDWFDIGCAFALHLWSPYPAGTLHVCAGPIMAAQDEFRATFHGRGGHGAVPHSAIDPIVSAAQAVTVLQAVVSRSVDPLAAAVVSVGCLHGGTAPNVIPDSAELHGTLRAFDESLRERLRQRVRQVLEGVALAGECRLEYVLQPGYPAVVNTVDEVVVMRRAAESTLGAQSVVEARPLMAAEDFAYFLRERPGAFALLGAGNPSRGIDAPHHSPRFDIDEAVLHRGAELLARVALDLD
jgi:amidohydrolase